MGGFNTVYVATFFGVAASRFGLSAASPLARPIVSKAGLLSIAKNTATAGGPAIMGFCIGVNAFGNPTELKNLLWNASTYRREFKAVQKEYYY